MAFSESVHAYYGQLQGTESLNDLPGDKIA